MVDSSRASSLIFRSSLILLCLTIQGAGLPNSQPGRLSKSVRPVAQPRKKKTNRKSVQKSKTLDALPAVPGKPIFVPKTQPEPEQSSSSPEPEAIDAPPLVEEADKVKWMFPNRSVAQIQKDLNFRLLVTVDGTVLQKESACHYRLTKGSVLICPANKTTLYTPHCTVELREGSVVTIESLSQATYIRDFHDRWKGHVVVKADDKTVYLMPGMELVVTSETDSTKAWETAIRHPIRRRDLTQMFSSPTMVVFKGDFSILDAMLKSEHFRLLRTSPENDAVDVIDEVTKTAALLHITDHKGPYVFMLP